MTSGLSYSYPGAESPALDGIDLEIGPGEFVVLAGRSASGKSTLLRAACGLVPHFHGGEIGGGIESAGRDVLASGPGELAAAVGFLAQEPETQIVCTTAAAEISLGLELRGASEVERARAVEEVSLALAAEHLLGRLVSELSGGEVQRVALAAALATRPELVLLDEPTSQLDPVGGGELIWLLRRLNEEWGVTVVVAEHRLERCLPAADRVVAMEAGRVAFDGAPREYLEWAVREAPALSTPGARLFSLAGLRPLPSGVREARARLAERGRVPPAPGAGRPAGGQRSSRWRRGDRRADGTALSARGLWVELGEGGSRREALRGLDLELRRGELVALMGRNGAGKSTLLRAACGLVDPVRGSVDTPAGAALLTQSPADYLVRERVSDELPGEAGAAALERVGLGEKRDSDPRDLSGGERQRLALAIALAGRLGPGGEAPGLIALDEPTRGLDRELEGELAALCRELAGAGSAVLVATHDVELAASFAERVVLFGEGEAIADGPAEEVLSGGWYFATETARILGVPGAITPEQGAAALAPEAAPPAGDDRGQG